jgi:transposase
MILGRVILAPPERTELKRRARSRSLAVEAVRRAKVILMLAGGGSYSEICERLGCTDRYIKLWKERFQQGRLSGLDSRYRGAGYRRRSAQTEARILELTRSEPTDASTHWSSYRLAKEVGVSQSTVSRVWRQFGLQPHRSRSYMASDDPDFEEKAADVIGLYLKPPVHAAVFCVDEKRRHPSARSPGPGFATFSRPGRTAWLRVLPPRNAFTLQRFEHSDWRGTG